MGIASRLAAFGRLLSLAVVASALACAAHAQAPIKIGSFLSVTGPAAFLGDPEEKTLQLYVEQINAAGGVLGRKLVLVAYDSGGNAEKARTFVKRLIEEDKVDAIVGGSTTGETMAVIPLIEQAQIPFISLAGAVEIVEPVKKWVFKTPATDRMACEKIFQDMRARGIARIGLISGDGGFDKSMRAQCMKVAPNYGIEIVGDETYASKDTDMTPQLTKLRQNTRIQAVLNCGFGQAPAIVTKNFRQIGMTVPLYQSHGVASKVYIQLAGGAANGVRLPAAALLVADELPAGDPQKPVVEAYKKDFESRYKQDVSTFGGHAYDGLMLITLAMKDAGTTDKAKVRDALEQIHGWMGVDGQFNLSPTDHLGLNLSAFRMLEIENGNWTLVK
jgi:branched-chain amino acid transport system substrate-binding protein